LDTSVSTSQNAVNTDNAGVHDTCKKMMYQLLTFGWRQSNIWPQYCHQNGGGF